MNIVKLIKNRRTVRAFSDKTIHERDLEKIISSGIWGPSLLAAGFQPWKFIIIKNKNIIAKISEKLAKRSETISISQRRILKTSASVVDSATVLIIVYNDKSLSKYLKRIKGLLREVAKCAEISAIAASMQNMILVAESIGIGSCWLDAPLFCEKQINKLSNCNDKLFAILALGYPKTKSVRSKRKAFEDTVKYIR